MSDIPALAPDRILRFHAPDKVFHSLNAITWFALLFTGMYVYFLNPSDEAAETAMLIHLILGAVFTFNLLGFIVIAPDRFALIMRACLEWDRNTIYWFRNFGGYPRRFFKIPFGPVEVPPQGRYNGGQKASYRCAGHGQVCILGHLLFPRLGFNHHLSPRGLCSYPARTSLARALQGHLASWPGHHLG